MKRVIFAVEDDAALQELYTYSLENEFVCRCFDNSESLFETLATETPDLFLLDIMLPGVDGFEILSCLKADKSTSQIPVIIVSAKGDEVSKVRGLNMGADDYLAKPFGVLELVARIKANLRKIAKGPVESTIFKDIVIDHTKHQAIINSQQILLTLKEYNLLHLLCENSEKALNRETIFQAVWDNNYIGETRTLDMHVKELRKKLAEAGSKASIQTIRGVGYMMI